METRGSKIDRVVGRIWHRSCAILLALLSIPCLVFAGRCFLAGEWEGLILLTAGLGLCWLSRRCWRSNATFGEALDQWDP